MNWETVDWAALERLRGVFLAGTGGREDYWRSERDLESYDATFGQRIAWKWNGVLRELRRRGWQPPSGGVLDWGCGTGVAARAFLEAFGPASAPRVALWDRSARAREFARRRIREECPTTPVDISPDPVNGLLLLSHVLTELDENQLRGVVELVDRAAAVIWVEPGTYAVSRSLIGLRERLRGPVPEPSVRETSPRAPWGAVPEALAGGAPGGHALPSVVHEHEPLGPHANAAFHVVAPCPHESTCGLLAPENAPHWCHHFVEPPPEVFTDGGWARFGRWAGIDLRSLPVSYLVLDRRPPPPLPAGVVRVLGRPRVYKAHALVFACGDTGVRDCRLTKRRLPEAFRELKRERFETLRCWKCVAGEVVETQAFEPG